MGETTVTVMENLTTAISTAIDTTVTLMEKALELAVGNPLVMIFVASGLVGIAIGLFQKLKNIAN